MASGTSFSIVYVCRLIKIVKKEYWLKKFLQSQASYYQSEYLKSSNYNKEEKILKNANEVLKPNEEFNQYSHLDGTFGVYVRQGVGPGKSVCWPFYFENDIPFDSKAGTGTCAVDLANQITR